MEKCCRVVAALGTVLFPAYYFIDAYTHQEKLKELTILRLATTLIFGLVYLSVRKNRFIIKPKNLIFMLLIFAAASITGMCLLTGGYRSPVYAGINLVVLTGALAFPVGALGMGFLVTCILAVYFVSVLVQTGFTIEDTAVFINNIYFLLCTGTISIAAAYLTEHLRKESFVNFLQVESAQKDLKHQNDIKSKFFANVTHELRTPLTLLLGPIRDILKEKSVPEKALKNLQVAERNGHVLLQHVGDLLDVAKLEAGNEEIFYSKIDLSVLVKKVLSQFEVLILEKKIKFTDSIRPAIMAEVDQQKIERILINLLSNAFKFTPEGGTIAVTLDNISSTHIVIKVQDSGPGIPADLRESVFERFYQIEESETRTYGGTGLGLSIVKEFAALMKGSVKVSDSTFGGAAFMVELPLKAPPGSSLDAAVSESLTLVERQQIPKFIMKPLSPQGDKSKPLILVVEDNPDMSQYISEVLSEDYRVLCAGNGREGVDLARKHSPDLILSDVMMPEFSGIDLLKAIRSDKDMASTLIIFLTARSDEELRLNLLQEGANDYILKPFSSEELLLRINNLVSLKRSRDILKSELSSSQNNVEHLATEVTMALDTAQKALQLREDFISLVSHELKTPLTSLKLLTQITLKKMEKAPEENHTQNFTKVLESNDHQLERLSRIVNDMLDLSKLKYDNLQLSRSQTNFSDMVKNILNSPPQQINTELLKVSGEQIDGYWDPFRLEQAFLNLLTNAFKYGLGKEVEVKTSQSHGEARISIRDHGIGIKDENLKMVFDQFFRAVHPNDYPGLGLGLFISQKIIQAHGGRISVESKFGEGSTFTIHLPVS